MNQNTINIITLTEYYLIMSLKTKLPFISSNRTVFLFSNKAQVQNFLENNNDTYAAEKQYYIAKDLVSFLFRIGAKNLHVCNEKEEVDVSILKRDIKKDYYNPDTTANLLLLKQFKKKKYLQNLSKCSFIVPIRIDARKAKFMHNIHYAYVSVADSGARYYVAFSDLKDFENWKLTMDGEWMPVEMNIRNINSIRNGNPLIINPLTSKIPLNVALLKKITAALQE